MAPRFACARRVMALTEAPSKPLSANNRRPASSRRPLVPSTRFIRLYDTGYRLSVKAGGHSLEVVVSIVVSIEPGRVRHCEVLSRQIARAVNELAFPCRTSL